MKRVILCPRCGSSKVKPLGVGPEVEREYQCKKCKAKFYDRYLYPEAHLEPESSYILVAEEYHDVTIEFKKYYDDLYYRYKVKAWWYSPLDGTYREYTANTKEEASRNVKNLIDADIEIKYNIR